MRCNTDREIWRRDRPMKREKERVRVDLSKLSSILNKLVDISDWRTIHYFHMNWFNFNKGLLFSRFIRYICTSACQMHLHICIFFLCLCVYLRFPWHMANRQMKQELLTSNAHRVIGVVTHNGFAVHSIGTNILNKERWTYNKEKNERRNWIKISDLIFSEK